MGKKQETLNLKRKSSTTSWLLIGGAAAVCFAASAKPAPETPKTEPTAAVAAEVKIPASLSSKFDGLFIKEGSEHGVSPILLAAVAKQETGFNPKAGSSAGAQGLMQFMPATAKAYGVDPWNPNQAVDGAARKLRDLTAEFKGNTSYALAAYNAGSSRVRQFGGVPPCSFAKCQTYNYVRSITAMVEQAS